MKHTTTREGDEFACSCGLRWGAEEPDPHYEFVEKMAREAQTLYEYKVTVENYDEYGNFQSLKEVFVTAPHCAVAANEAEDPDKGVYAVDAIRVRKVTE